MRQIIHIYMAMSIFTFTGLMLEYSSRGYVEDKMYEKFDDILRQEQNYSDKLYIDEIIYKSYFWELKYPQNTSKIRTAYIDSLHLHFEDYLNLQLCQQFL